MVHLKMLQASIEALAEIDELLKHEDKSDLIGPCMDHLFSMCSMQVVMDSLSL